MLLHRAGLTASAGLSCYTLRCPAPFWLIQCKPCRNWFITAKVIDKSLGARFLWPTVYVYLSTNFYPHDAMLVRIIVIAMCLSVRLSVRHTLVLCQNEES